MSQLMELQIEVDGIPITVHGHYYEGCPERGERGYSLGTPAEPESFTVSAIYVAGKNATDFFDNYMRAESLRKNDKVAYHCTNAIDHIEALCLDAVRQR